MKRIGLLGGMSWESTAQYYRYINQEVRVRRGGLRSADRNGDEARIDNKSAQNRLTSHASR